MQRQARRPTKAEEEEEEDSYWRSIYLSTNRCKEAKHSQ
jgi:hypothetical protein